MSPPPHTLGCRCGCERRSLADDTLCRRHPPWKTSSDAFDWASSLSCASLMFSVVPMCADLRLRPRCGSPSDGAGRPVPPSGCRYGRIGRLPFLAVRGRTRSSPRCVEAQTVSPWGHWLAHALRSDRRTFDGCLSALKKRRNAIRPLSPRNVASAVRTGPTMAKTASVDSIATTGHFLDGVCRRAVG